jgi:mannosyl-oligosaccharide alpha-1,2-mannosidase
MPAPILPSPASERTLPRRFTIRWLLVGIAVVSAVLFFSTPTRERARQTIYDWSRPPGPPVDSHRRPPFYTPSPAEHPSSTTPNSVWANRALEVKNAFLHAYHGYMEHAYPHDEITPLFNGSQDKSVLVRFRHVHIIDCPCSFYGFGVTVVDSLDTMIIMGLEQEYEHAVEHVASLRFDANQTIGFFEPVIRYLGGLISAYALTNNSIFLARADDLGSHMLPAFNTSSGLPATNINLKTSVSSQDSHFLLLTIVQRRGVVWWLAFGEHGLPG